MTTIAATICDTIRVLQDFSYFFILPPGGIKRRTTYQDLCGRCVSLPLYFTVQLQLKCNTQGQQQRVCAATCTSQFDFTFNVPVDLFFRVQVVEPFQDLLQHGGDLILIKRTRPQLEKYTHISYASQERVHM